MGDIERRDIDDLINNSSLGTEHARHLQAFADPDTAAVIGKPADDDEPRRELARLGGIGVLLESGKRHPVWNACWLAASLAVTVVLAVNHAHPIAFLVPLLALLVAILTGTRRAPRGAPRGAGIAITPRRNPAGDGVV